MNSIQGEIPIPPALVKFLNVTPQPAKSSDEDYRTAMNKPEAGLKVVLIDSDRFSQECFNRAFVDLYPESILRCYTSIQDFGDKERNGVGLILYYSHSTDVTPPSDLRRISEIRALFPQIPLVVLSAADDAQQPKVVRRLLEAGALGVIPTKTTGISMSLAVIRFVQAGGTFVPPDLLLAGRQDRATGPAKKTDAKRLTARQMAVLAHLDRGKANKLIAYELGMSESTVKVHVRNIMRKLNATNRTQAVYKARELWSSDEMLRLADD